MKTPLRVLMLCLCAPAAALSVARAKDISATDPVKTPATASAAGPIVQLHGQKVDVPALRAKAEALRGKSNKKRGSKETQEADLEEAEVLIKLAPQQDPDLDLRRHQLVEKLKKDETVPKATRFRLAGISANIEISRNHALDPGQRMAAHAAVAWKLVEDFPDNPEGYASLLRIARDGDDALAASIADQLLISKAPENIKDSARVLHARVGLLGKSLAEVAGDSFELPGQKPICLFAWSALNRSTATMAASLKRELPAETTIVAVCLDGDTPESRAVAAETKVPIEWIYPAGGRASALCQRLLLAEPTMYLISAEGKIDTVSGFNRLATQRWQKSKGGRK